MVNRYRFILIAALTLLFASCSTADVTKAPDEMPDTEQPADDQETEQPREEEKPEHEKEQSFEEQIKDTISLEGMEEPITLNLYDHPDALFLTYVPEDLLAEEASGGEGDSYFFYANYGGEKLEEIYLQIYIFAEHITEQPSAEATDSTYALAVENMEPMEDNTYYEWALEEYISPEGSRNVALGEHNSRYFMVVLNSDVQYSEGFVPRANKVLEHLYWKDTEEYLTKE